VIMRRAREALGEASTGNFSGPERSLEQLGESLLALRG
jgi:hypothetical protein